MKFFEYYIGTFIHDQSSQNLETIQQFFDHPSFDINYVREVPMPTKYLFYDTYLLFALRTKQCTTEIFQLFMTDKKFNVNVNETGTIKNIYINEIIKLGRSDLLEMILQHPKLARITDIALYEPMPDEIRLILQKYMGSNA